MESLHLAGVALAALLSENFLLVSCLGLNIPAASIRDPVQARRTGVSILLSVVVTVFFTWLTDNLLLRRFGLEHFRLLAFTLITFGTLALLRWALRTFLPELHNRLDKCLSALSTNCAALGAALLCSTRGYALEQALTFAFCGGLGVLLVLLSYAGLREDVNFDACPRAFRGVPIELITAGLMALAMVGFYGLHIS